MTEEEKIYESDGEDYEDYCTDGYHPVYLGEKYHNGRYKIIQKLGWGHFSTVWMAYDSKEKRNVALKIQKSKESYSEAAMDEIDLLNTLRVSKEKPEWEERRAELQEKRGIKLGKNDIYCIEIKDNFKHFGMHGKHYCSTFDIMGPNLLDIMLYFEEEFNAGVPIFIVKSIAKQLLIGLDYMHRISGLIHTDLKPENIMVQLHSHKEKVFEEQLSNVKILPTSMKFLDELKKNNSKKKKRKKRKRKKNDKGEDAESGGHSSIVPVIKKQEGAMQVEKVEVRESKKNIIPTFGGENKKKDGAMEEEGKGDNDETCIQEEKFDMDEKEVIKGESEKKSNISEKIPKEPQHNKPTQSLFDGLVITNKEGKGLFDNLYDLDPSNKSQSKESSKKSPQEKTEPAFIPNKISLPEPDEDEEYQPSNESVDEEAYQDGEEEQEQRTDPYNGETDFIYLWKKNVQIHLNKDLRIKIVDFGNACWVDKHFTDCIQTREYRSPEAIIGSTYTSNTDMWSFACIIFELLTGDFLFKPSTEGNEPKDEKHLALMMATLGKIPKNIALEGKYSRDFFNKNGKLLNCKVPAEYTISQILVEEYGFDYEEAEKIEDFLRPMLEYDIEKRCDAKTAFEHEWLWC